ncbi:hypothetical protein [Methylobacterium sp. SyP6R]|uniref:hypothetical protein n=1 Tax=Methylobacterium sp. SyP6R TaxID=2718876 RepID=UPI001F26CD01|nr:hypothetical protein [Methylobacterium sp. SyP6R]MCF4125196.1 hypothetical protein [Methylobacterium sp. SyP6R]
MLKRDDYMSRRQIRERTGWSLTFIDRRLPRIKIGGKVLIPVAAFERLLNGEAAR